MSEKIDVLQARIKEDAEPVHAHNDMPDIKINSDLSVSETSIVVRKSREPDADGDVKPFGLSDKLENYIKLELEVWS
ncbi:MAG: hypothetical protein IAC77_01025 [Proteobacteria bacterium]|uniref:Uncharacterized protein n=1 Tax=Candidatus Enterousia excrementavium TaxID=2840789 RepID=A0A940IBQ3_9PROT|nr:hypothetical protein [Candidatus Enterousia excrementavium]